MLKVESEESLFQNIAILIENSRRYVAKVINTAMVYTYYGVGQYIVEYEQYGKSRAEYGKGILKRLSERLTSKYGRGWSVETLKKCRLLYTTYQIGSTAQTQSEKMVHTSDQIHKFVLSWNHYQVIMREKNPLARNFYEIEAYNQQWSVRQLQRQVASSLYERLALSRDKEEVMRLANEGQTIEKPTIGILLCKEKNDALVELTLPADTNVYAQEYALCLPDKTLLQQKLKEWFEEFKYLETNED